MHAPLPLARLRSMPKPPVWTVTGPQWPVLSAFPRDAKRVCIAGTNVIQGLSLIHI